MLLSLNKAAEDSGIGKVEILYHCNRGDTGYVKIGPGDDNVFVNEDDIIDLMIEKEIMG